MFGGLEESEMEVVIDAMDEQKIKAGETIITEGEKRLSKRVTSSLLLKKEN